MLKSCIQWGSGLVLAVALGSVSAQTVHIAHCMAGCPEGAPAANDIVVRQLFAASINNQSGLADWIAYRVLPDTVGVASLLPREWQADALAARELPDNLNASTTVVQPDLRNSQDREYRVSEFIISAADRGRLVPMSSFAGTPYWDDLNYLSNMAPIPADLRIGPWSRLDQAVNELAERSGEVFVVSGPLFLARNKRSALPETNQPTAYFKFVATAASHAAFVFPADMPQHGNYCNQISSITRLQESSGLILLPLRSDPGDSSLYKMLGCDGYQLSE